ncbi:MAG: glutathione peroxidase [Bacteriovoracaceae bacterium]
MVLTLLLFFNVTFAQSKNDLFTQSLKDLRGRDLNLSQFKGKSLLVVNIATRCGYTPQLDDLEDLYKKYKSKGFVIIGVPSNDFGSQTPEVGENIEKFCRLNYGVTFPLTEKLEVSGPGMSPFVKHVLSSFDNKSISWNFEKFLFDRKGNPVARFSSDDKPMGSSIEKAVLKALENQ